MSLPSRLTVMFVSPAFLIVTTPSAVISATFVLLLSKVKLPSEGTLSFVTLTVKLLSPYVFSLKFEIITYCEILSNL